jgi:hypothetical protein
MSESPDLTLLEVPMRPSTFAVALSFLIAFAWIDLHGDPPRAAEAKPSIQKLEYRNISWNATGLEGQTLNDLGDQGWEMCGTVRGDNYTTLIFKRPKQ